MTTAPELPRAAEVRAGLRVAWAASGLRMLLDQHRLTGRQRAALREVAWPTPAPPKPQGVAS